MGDLSEIGADGRAAVTIEVPPHWADHRFQGRAVLPAVEAMQLLAHWALQFRPGLDVRRMGAASFDRFLVLPPPGNRIDAWCEMQEMTDGSVRAVLLTKTQSKSTRMTRAKVHAQLDFYPLGDIPSLPALDLASALEGESFSVDPRPLYDELVPFGPGFRSICRPLQLTAEGALAVIHAPEEPDRQTDLHLGSPFVLDGAFQAACVWSQRFAGVVAFPVGVDQRLLVQPTCPGSTYFSRIFPIRTEPPLLTFDIWIVDGDGRLFEWLRGVRMRDVSGGKLLPPDWVRSRGAVWPRGHISGHGAAVALIDRATLMPFADRCLAESERHRTFKMCDKRRIDYLSARLACKRLSRRLLGNDYHTPAQEIVTLDEDGIRPRCPAPDGRSCYCSVSHDRRFAVAVAGGKPVGVDVETLDERVLKCLHIFMDADEQEIVKASPLGQMGAAVRVWTTKEAMTKMLNIHLADAWERTHVLNIEAERSDVLVSNGPAVAVFHQLVDDHLITLVCAV